MRRYLNMKRLTGTLLLFLLSNMAWAGPAPISVWGIDPPVMKVLDGSLGQMKVDSFIVVEDAKFFDAAYNSLLIKPYPVKNMVSLEINEDAHIPIPEDFETWVTLQITVTHSDGSVEVLDDKTLSVGYDNFVSYTNRNTFVFDNAYRVEVKIKALKTDVNPDIWKVIKVVNQLQSFPQYNFSCTGNAVTAIYDSAWAANTTKDELPVYWAPAIGADEYDLEWTYVDASALASGEYGTDPNHPNPALIFDNNASRVTITGTYYKIPLVYDNTGHLFFRVRPVQRQAGGGRTEAHWSSDYTNGLGRFNYNGHERPLNWQATTSFAEEGKRKTVVQYYDGSLRSRQTVTKDNSTEKTIVAENFYDYQGRPVVQVLPAPTLNSMIGYSKNFNRGLNSASGYDKSLFDTLASADLYCTTGAPAMDTTSGASQYYSHANPLADSGFHKYIPDAEGYPFTEVEYTQDNTGRISRQSGVGKTFRIGSGHETKNFYGTADQRELDALFGTEVGHFSHYFKTMVRDPNGQYSVSYTDMRGRTIAAALAGVPPDNVKLDTLSSYTSAVRTEKLSDPSATVIKDWVMENKKGLLVSKAGDHTFTYKLDPQTLQQEGCTQAQICYECLYDLQITITDDCNNQKLGGAPFDTVIHNFQIGQIDTSCKNNSGGFSFSFTKFLEEGSYEVTKKLSVSRYGLNYYRDSIFLKTNTCKTIDDFIQEQRKLLAGVLQCRPTCQSCTDSLGTWDQFWTRFRRTSGIADSDTAGYRNMALTAYAKAQEDCAALCDSTVTEANDIRRNMLMDMTPSSGQYANIDNNNDVLSIFFSSADGDAPDTTATFQDVTNYIDASGNPDLVFDEGSGQLVPPQNLSPEVFAQKFKLSWAEALLHLHPEYCKLQRYEQLKASHEWDKRFAEIDTWQEAREKGYLNPIRDGSFPAHLNGAGTDVKDPLAEFKNGLFNSKLKDSLLKYRNIQGGTISLWAVASVTTMCQKGTDNQACFQTYSNNAWAMNPDTMCVGELNMAWRAYRQMYLDVKRYIINKYWIKDSCNNALTAAQLMERGFTPHFSDADELAKAAGGTLPSDTTQAKNEIGNKMDNYYQSNCLAYATQWMQQLSKCTFYDSASITDIIIPQLVQVCMEGSDVNHPYGASSVKPSSTSQFRSFEEVINNYNQTHGITDYINCNSYRITAPKPYDQQLVYGNKPIYNKPEDCECEAIAGYYNKYQNASGYSSFSDYLKKVYNTTITDAALNQLLSLCKVNGAPPASCSYLESPLFLPPAFQCYTGDICISCEQFKTAEQAFRSKFPGISPVAGMVTDSIQIRNNRLYEQFMNYRFGFAKTIDEYLAFAKGCGMPVDSVSELQSIVSGYKASTSAASSWYYVGTGFQVTDPHQLFRDGQIKLPDSYHSTPAYCCVSPVNFFGKTVCLPDGYQVEARIRTTGWLLASLNVYSTDSTTAGGYICEYQSDGTTIYGGSFIDGRNQFISGQTIATVAGSLADWHVIKMRVTKTAYEQYVDGQLIKVYQKVPRLYGQPVGPIPGIFLSFASMEAAVDWVKLSDVNGVTQYFEDFNDPDNQSLVNGNAICPSATCTTDFANYFNQQKGTSYNFSQIDSLYLANGIALNVCNTDTSTNTGGITCDSLMTIYNNAVCLYNSLSDPLVNTHQCNIANWVVQGVYNATNKFFQTTELITPSVISNGYIHMPYPDSSTRYGSVAYNSQRWWRVQNEYALEARVRNIGGTDVDFAINNNSLDDPGYEREEDFYIAFIPQWAVGYYNLQGVRHYDSAFGGRNFNDWRTVKYVVKPDRFQVYFDGQLIKELMRDGHHYIYRLVYPYIKGNVGESLQIDWIKMYGAGDSLMFYENFDNYPSLSRPDPFFLEPRQDCKPFFEQYFNSRTGKNYTYDQIKAFYRTQCGATINFCPEESTLTLCGRAEPVFPPVALDDINNCSDTTFIIASKAQELYNVYLDSLKGHFDSSYIARCLQAYKLERFTVRHAVSEYHHTLYYYDLAGNLIKTVPPAGVRANYDSLWLDSVEVFRAAGSRKVPAHELATQYRYNTLNNTVSQKSPDGGKTEFWYDRLGRLALTRNARQKAAGGLFSYTRYDALGRITEVGQVKDPAVSQISDNLTRNETALNNWLTGLAGYRGQVTNTIYDIPYTGFGTVNNRLIVQQKNLRNRVSYTSYADSPGVSAAYNTATFYSYDIHGNVDTLLQDYGQSSVVANIMNTQNNRFKKLVYQYDLISGKVNMVMYQPGWSDEWYHRYRYDAENRLIEAETSLDSFVWEKDARYEYYRHGPLARTVLGQQEVQGIDYAYTLQGWLKGVNSTGGTVAHDMGSDGKDGHLNQFIARDAFGFSLNYFAGEYKPVGNGVDPFPGYSGRLTDLNNYRPLYNGNISSMSIYNRRFEGEPGGPLHFYNYRYDQLNRLTGQDVYKGFDIEANSWNGMTGNNDYLKERIAYDANGNILKYLRNAMSGSGVAMDSLTYKYYKGTNQLRQVRDAVGDNTYQSQEDNLIADIDNQTDTSNYVYDEIGNLVKDKAEGISNIKWSVYGKILEITRTATDKVPVTTIKYTYDAQGNRIGKITDAGGEKQYTWYVRDGQGNIITTYAATGNSSDLSALQLKQEERYIYGSSRLGMYKYPDVVSGGPDDRWSQYNGNWFDRGLRQYELTNHLGNVLATLSDKKIGVPSETNSSLIAYYKPEIRGAQDYYPFGMMSRIASDRYWNNYRFGFNGKENDNDVKGLGNQQDYGMRIYDPRVGRFLSMDPLTKGYAMLTPYQFASNTPIGAIDIDGEESGIPINGVGVSGTPLSNYYDNAKGRKTMLKALGIGVAVGGAVLMDIYVTKGAATRYTLYTLGVWGTMEFVSTVNNNSNQHDPKIRAENERKAKQQATELIIGFGIGKFIGKTIQGGRLIYQETKGAFNARAIVDDPMTAEMSQSKGPFPSLSKLPDQEDRIFNHFTNLQGTSGITGVNPKALQNLKPGESITVDELNFGKGTNTFMANSANDIFVTDLPVTSGSGQLNNIGVFGDKQGFVISFSEAAAFGQGVRVRGANSVRGIFTIPGGSRLQGTFKITRTGN